MFKRKIRKLLKKKIVPAPVFNWYFQRRVNQRKEALSDLLGNGRPLLDQLSEERQQYWRPRIELVVECPDNADIPRVPEAGKVIDGQLVMHNGLRIDPFSYYSYPMLDMLMQNRGVHEPQEEKAFRAVLDSLPAGKPYTFLELGAYWAFYSMWFLQQFPTARCIMVEPDRENLYFGKENFRLNGLQGEFLHYGIGKAVNSENNVTTVDEICRRKNIEFVDILHTDIQGYELEMLQGAEQLLKEQRVGFVFISTHSAELHANCKQILIEKYGFQLVADVDLEESFSWDGILVMKAAHYDGLEQVAVSKREMDKKSSV